jgi:hypothetical protein
MKSFGGEITLERMREHEGEENNINMLQILAA